MIPTVGSPLNDALGDAVAHASTGDPVVSNGVLGLCGMEVSSGSAAPQLSNSGIADLVARPKLGLG